MENAECPYCGEYNEISCDDNDPNVQYEMECQKCEKTFGFYIEYDLRVTSEHKLPCKNGESHIWKRVTDYTEKCMFCNVKKKIAEVKDAR